MARRVVSLLRGPPAVLRTGDPALEANAYAVAEDVDLTLVLAGAAVEFAFAGGDPATPADLAGLVESGVRVLVAAADLARLGAQPDDLVAGVQVADDTEIATTVVQAEAVLTW